jgi:hypothetical protein
MTQITATVNSQPITASISAAGAITASVGSSVVTAHAGGGIGPQGPSGATGGNLGQLADVQIVSVQNGDVLRYSSSKWRNYPESDIVIDGQNF